MKLLIVDDSAMVRRLIETAYRGSVFTEINTAADGILAVTMYKQFCPDVVTLDITMPNMDGLAALTQILEYNPAAKVLVISALADHHTAIESLKRGASQFICKPFTAEDLRGALEEVMNPPQTRRTRSRRRGRGPASPPQGETAVPQALSPPAPEPGQYFPAPEVSPQAPSQQSYPSGFVPPPVSQVPLMPNRGSSGE